MHERAWWLVNGTLLTRPPDIAQCQHEIDATNDAKSDRILFQRNSSVSGENSWPVPMGLTGLTLNNGSLVQGRYSNFGQWKGMKNQALSKP